MASSPRHTCLKLQIPNKTNEQQHTDSIFVKATWFSDYFDLSVTDGIHAWTCHASKDEVSERASQWDQPVSDYIELAERYLGFQQPGSVYGFADAGEGQKRLSWTFEREGTKLEWRWKCQPSPNSKETTTHILDFLMDSNIRLSEQVVRQKRGVEMIKAEADKCLAQSERFSHEKEEFESAIYAKFLGVLNTKKAKLRELRDQLSKKGNSGKLTVEDDEEESTDKTESFYEKTDDGDEESEKEESAKNLSATSKDVPASRPRGRKRKY